MMGDVDYLLCVVMFDMQSFEYFIVYWFMKIFGVLNIWLSFVLKQVCYKIVLLLLVSGMEFLVWLQVLIEWM